MNVTAQDLTNNPPSSLRIAIPPFVGTLGSSEIEHAAALIVRACQVRADKWQPLLWDDLQKAITPDVENRATTIAALVRNPFFSPDFVSLVEKGWAAWHGKPGTGKLELAPRAIMAIALKWGRVRG